MFKRYRHTAAQHTADTAYAAIVAQARRPDFYRQGGVPDTIDGRFDLLVMHAFLFFHRLKGEGSDARNIAQRVFDTMFSDLDHNLREMGVGDMSIGKKIRKMGDAFYGRTRAYDKAVQQYDANPAALAHAVARNVFASPESDHRSAALAEYMIRSVHHLEQQDTEALIEGRVRFPEAALKMGN